MTDQASPANGNRFWVDLENAPDVLFFEPIVAELRARGHEVLITTRPFSDVPELAELYGIGGDPIGRHGGKQGWRKAAFGLGRAAGLARWAAGKHIDLAVGFGSRPLAVACGGLRLPNATVFDYEHVSVSALARFCQWILVPEEVPADVLIDRGVPAAKLVRYRGLKEEVYTGLHRPDPSLRRQLGLDAGRTLVVVRPPAVSAHYHDPVGEQICHALLERIAAQPDVQCLLLARDGETLYDHFIEQANIEPLSRPVRGLDLIAAADVVISGGGTMVREAAALGVASYSIFTGEPGAVDAALAADDRLRLIRTVDDVDGVVLAVTPSDDARSASGDAAVRDFFVDQFLQRARPAVEPVPVATGVGR